MGSLRQRAAAAASWAALLVLSSCAGGPASVPGSTTAPAPAPAPPDSSALKGRTSGLDLVVGGEPAREDDPDALYLYRFRQIDPGSDRFTFQDRDLSFYFRPTPEALHFQVENRQDQPVWIDWDRSRFVDGEGRSLPLAHQGITWEVRFSTPAPTQIQGLERYTDYAFPMESLVDPAGSDKQIHKRLFAVDSAAPSFQNQVFGVDLYFRVEDKPRTYSFRFRVESVVPR